MFGFQGTFHGLGHKLLVAGALAAAILVSNSADAANYYVWTCYGGSWNSSAITPSYSQAQSYERTFKSYGYTTQITTGQRPTGSCGKAQTCLYNAYVSYGGKTYYLSGYTTPAAAEKAGRDWARGVGRGATYLTYKRVCS